MRISRDNIVNLELLGDLLYTYVKGVRLLLLVCHDARDAGGKIGEFEGRAGG